MTGKKWWEVVPSGATLHSIDPKSGTAIFTAGKHSYGIDLFTDEVKAEIAHSIEPRLPKVIDITNASYAERQALWMEQVAGGDTVRGMSDWVKENTPKYIVAKGTLDVYVYVDPKEGDAKNAIKAVVADDCSLGSADELTLGYANEDHSVISTPITPEHHQWGSMVLDGEVSADWPAWQFGW